MKANTILVQALEEFPYNTEFVGRNFNAGEVIQLVLRDRNGRWLPQRMVEMVMVHELAHCKQMNHSKAFWKVRDAYAVDLRALWSKGYTGEGMWGRGRGLDTGGVQASQVDVGDVPEHLCGGTYGHRSKKRRRGGKQKEMLSYAERKQRRILKKFGVGGQSLGADEDVKVKLEGGMPKKGKPRVAGSARGRELRAAAALARFEPVKNEQEDTTIKKEEVSDSDTDDEYDITDQADAALDVDGSKMIDDKGRALIKICEEEDMDDRDGNAKREMEEIQSIAPQPKLNTEKAVSNSRVPYPGPAEQYSKLSQSPTKIAASSSAEVIHLDEFWKRRPGTLKDSVATKPKDKLLVVPAACNVCSLSNAPGSLTCAVCSNVLNPKLVPNHWKCNRGSCKYSDYLNAGDAGACGVCARLKPVLS